ncbi:MAG: tRNA (guanosine(37)-N1)-methyltransferase TrmD [Patescibacteria group bacterium]
MRFNIITIFPRIFDSYLNESILKRAQKKKLVNFKIHNLRDFTKDKHKKVDDRPFGGGPGMVMQIQPIIRAVEFAKSKANPPAGGKKLKIGVILFTPGGKQFDNKIAAQMAKNYNQLILICGRYEGIDERVKKAIKDLGLKVREISIGPYVLTGGELPAMVLIDSVSRQITGALGNIKSLEERRYGLPVYPHTKQSYGVGVYTRPEIFMHKGKKYKTPEVLLSGNHKKIDEWHKNKIKR